MSDPVTVAADTEELLNTIEQLLQTSRAGTFDGDDEDYAIAQRARQVLEKYGR